MINKRHFVQTLIAHILFYFSKNDNLFKNYKNIFYFFGILISIFFYKSNHSKTCRIINKPIEFDEPTTSYNFELPIYQAKEDSEEDCDISEEMARLLEHESKALQPHQEPMETINLGKKEEKKKFKAKTTLGASIKERLIKLLQEYVDVFSWLY